MSFFIFQIFSNPVYVVSWIALMIFSVCLHELGHAIAAYYEGDSTAKDLGYFTLNPMVHMGPVSLVILLLVGICWGACPVQPRNFRRRHSDAIVSFAGPLVNLLLMVSFVIFRVALEEFFLSELSVAGSPALIVHYICLLGAYLNGALFLLNMIPIPPLDGHTILADFVPSLIPFYRKLGNGGLIILFLVLALPGVEFWPLADGFADRVADLVRLVV